MLKTGFFDLDGSRPIPQIASQFGAPFGLKLFILGLRVDDDLVHNKGNPLMNGNL